MKLLASLTAAIALAGCGTTGGGAFNQLQADKVVVDADSLFIGAASALNEAEKLHPELAAKAEPIRAQAFRALMVIRQSADTGVQPSTASLVALVAQITALVNGAK